ncbi:DNA recombination/repair protein RecA, partial [Enterococcus faecalis]
MSEVSKLVRDAYCIGDGSTIREEAEGQEELPLVE